MASLELLFNLVLGKWASVLSAARDVIATDVITMQGRTIPASPQTTASIVYQLDKSNASL